MLTKVNILTEIQRMSNEIDLINRLRLRPISVIALSKLVNILQNVRSASGILRNLEVINEIKRRFKWQVLASF